MAAIQHELEAWTNSVIQQRADLLIKNGMARYEAWEKAAQEYKEALNNEIK